MIPVAEFTNRLSMPCNQHLPDERHAAFLPDRSISSVLECFLSLSQCIGCRCLAMNVCLTSVTPHLHQIEAFECLLMIPIANPCIACRCLAMNVCIMSATPLPYQIEAFECLREIPIAESMIWSSMPCVECLPDERHTAFPSDRSISSVFGCFLSLTS